MSEIQQWDNHRKTQTAVYRWDCLRGLESVLPDREERQMIQDPAELVTHLAEIPGPAVAFLENFHRFIEGAETVQALQNARQALSTNGVTLIAVSPIVTIPAEVSKLFKVVPFELPTREELRQVFVEIASAANLGEQPPELLEELAEAALGLTRFEAENAAALCSVVSSGKFSPEIVAHMKSDMIRQSSTLEIGVFEETFEELRGVDRMKDFALKSLGSNMYRGILVLGPAGTGKTHFAKALGNAVRMPTIIADVNRIMAAGQALVGQSEARAQQTVDIINAQGRCVVMFDEIKTLCRVAKMLDTSLEEAVQFVVPVCRTAKEKVQALREWAQGRAVHAHRREQGGAGKAPENASVRRIVCGN